MTGVKRLLEQEHPFVEDGGSVWHSAHCGHCSRWFRHVPYPCPTMEAVEAYEAAVDALERLLAVLDVYEASWLTSRSGYGEVGEHKAEAREVLRRLREGKQA